MKPPPFKLLVAGSVEEAVEALEEYGDDAKILAGGQSLIPLMNMRLARPSVLIDINRLDALEGIEANGGFTIGAITRQAAVERSAAVRSLAPVVCEALRHVSHPGVRSRGTFGGAVAHADPASEIPAVLLALDGEVVARGPNGERTVPASELFVTTFTTSLADDEVITHVRFPPIGDRRWAFLEVARRHGDFALAGVVNVVDLDADGTCRSAAIALFGVSHVPGRAREAEELLVGQRLTDATVLEEAGRAAAAALDPSSDFHASSEYRRDVTAVLVRRALAQAAAREEGGQQ